MLRAPLRRGRLRFGQAPIPRRASPDQGPGRRPAPRGSPDEGAVVRASMEVEVWTATCSSSRTHRAQPCSGCAVRERPVGAPRCGPASSCRPARPAEVATNRAGAGRSLPAAGPAAAAGAGAARPGRVAALLRRETYPFPLDDLELHETHISWVVLAGPYAYKMKKPVDLGFLDFTTLERRRAACLDEVRLNRRLCPDVYLGVVDLVERADGGLAVGGPGRPVEPLVWMPACGRGHAAAPDRGGARGRRPDAPHRRGWPRSTPRPRPVRGSTSTAASRRCARTGTRTSPRPAPTSAAR